MKNYILLAPLSLLILSIFFISCEDENCIDNIGAVITEERTVDSFHSLHLKGVANVFLSQGETQKVEIQANELLLDYLTSEVKNEILEIDLDKCSKANNYTLDIYITIPEIKGVTLDGVGNLFANNDWDLDELDINLRGVGNATLMGSADALNIDSDGVGNIYAFDLSSRICDINVSGIGNVEVNVTESLNIEIEGTANVYYKGNPTITTLIKGSGNVIDAN